MNEKIWTIPGMMLWIEMNIKRAAESCFTLYCCVIFNLFNTGWCRSAFFTYSFWKLVFRLLCFLVFFCFKSNVLNQVFNICFTFIKKGASCSLILFLLYKGDIQLLHYHIIPQIWTPLPLFAIVQFW